MWVYEHGIETDVAPEAVWRLWTDVEHWGDWNADVAKVELRGPFVAGTGFTMVTAGGDPIELRLAEVVEGRLFVDEAEFDGLVLRTTHRLDPLDGGRTRVVYRMEITGPAADQAGSQVGPAVTADWPDTMAALVARASGA